MSRRLIRLRIIEKKRDLANALDDVLAAMADPQTGLQEVPLDAGIVPRMIPKTAVRNWREVYQIAVRVSAIAASIRNRHEGVGEYLGSILVDLLSRWRWSVLRQQATNRTGWLFLAAHIRQRLLQ